MGKHIRYALVLAGLLVLASSAPAAQDDNPFLGRWALTIPGGGAGWLGVTQENGYLDASLLWGGGSVLPVDSVFVNGEDLFVVRLTKVERKDPEGKVVRTQMIPDVIQARLEGDTLQLTQMVVRRNGNGVDDRGQFTGKRIPPLPGKPDLSKVKFGPPIVLFDGKNLEAWKLTDPRAKSGWSIEDGLLVNKPVQPQGGRHVSYGNLRTVAEFEDFNLKLEVNVLKGENSGVYLRGIYEVQVCDSYGRKLDSHNMGGIYSRITPTVNAEKPPGEWQTMDLTLVDRHATVVLNGKKIIDNEPLLGCTGGALWSDEFKPGPIYLQGDHTGVKYRNIVITPVVK
jgi:3-keto-disaccharide hydrolase